MKFADFSLTGKVAVVTGCSRGLGEGIALGLAEAGADIFGVDIDSASDTLHSRSDALGRCYLHARFDLRNVDAPKHIMEAVHAEFGQCDILVNNAGVIRRAQAIEVTYEEWDEVMNVNLRALFFLCCEFAKPLLEVKRSGKIINIASMLSFQGSRNVASYTASKTGVVGVTRLLANEFAPHGINVNAIAPGYMDTQNTEPLIKHPVRGREVLKMIPAGRWGQPEDLIGPAVFLASSASDYLHGAIIPVDGGWLAGNV